MSPSTVVEELDVLKDIGLGFFAGLVIPVVDEFGFESAEDALHRRVVPAVPPRLMQQIIPWE
jgi:hypothetical protein